ncbi:MAG: arginine--tRNA ligase [Deltaproteobacteria bacterium]|nr:arginine--tRNA ligase [Deltaproteobacteria bacterium]
MKKKVRKYLQEALGGDLPEYQIERSKLKVHGELTTNLAMILAKERKQNPRQLAQEIVSHLSRHADFFEKIEVAGAGFINFTLKKSVWQESLKELATVDWRSLVTRSGEGKKALVEFISGNPTGPLHVGNARGGPLGDVIASLLQAIGYEVTREYYINDIGGQIDHLGAGILYEYLKLFGIDPGSEPPQYKGAYVHDLAEKAKEKFARRFIDTPREEAISVLGPYGVELVLEWIRSSCEKIGIRFDSWVHEKGILASETNKTLQSLEAKKVVQEKEGALWFAPKDEFLEDREAVLRRSDGRPTYFANDLAYHALKYRRGFDFMVNVWGANHHGHLPRMNAGVSALGFDPEKLHVVFYQTVRLKRGGEIVAMSKREGNLITVEEVVDEVGKDALRFFLLMRAAESHLDFDLDLAKRHTQENPVYYVQYAHARLASIFRKAENQGISMTADPHLTRLDLPEEIELIRLLHEFPEEVERAANSLEPHRIPFYLLELAKAFQSYYARAKEDKRYWILGTDIDTTRAKLYLGAILKKTLAQGLELIGVSAPEVMDSE